MGPQGKKWLYAHSLINSTEDFRIRITGLTQSSGSSIAIDDVKLTKGICHQAMFCDFEVDLCGWESRHIGKNGWNRDTGSGNSSDFKPDKDRTLGTPDGYFLYMPMTSETHSDMTPLNSPPFENYGEMCLELWYMIGKEGQGSLEIYQIAKFEDLSYLIWKRVESHPPKQWVRGRATLKRVKSFEVQIRAVSGVSASEGFAAIDDIQILDGTCSDPASCDFERDTCGWTNWVENSTFNFVRIPTGLNQLYGFTPAFDHTIGENGHFMYAPLRNKTNGDSAILMSEDIDLPRSEHHCFEFWIYRYDSRSTNVDVYFKTPAKDPVLANSITDRATNKDQRWIHRHFTASQIALKESYINWLIKVVVKETFGKNRDAGIAIDDISVLNYQCGSTTPTPPVTTPLPPVKQSKFNCDFEVDMCLWESDNDSWLRKRGQSTNQGLFPKTDHSTMTTSGHYVYPVITYHEGEMILSSKDVVIFQPGFSGSCIKFWYYLHGTSNVELQFNLVTPDHLTVLHNLWSRSEPQGMIWISQQVRILQNGTFQMAFHLKKKGWNYLDVQAAIDDITYIDGPCPPAEMCTVEDDGCSFYASPDSDIKWSVGSGVTTTSGPKTDRTLQTENGHYFYIDPNNVEKENSTAVLETDQYPADRTCIQFWYYLSGKNVGTLNVYARVESENSLLWQESGDEGAYWHLAQARVIPKPPMPFKYYFQAVTGPQIKSGIIALDDIEILDRCSPPGSCNFDEPTCSWYNDPSATLKFERVSGAQPETGPSADHTFKTIYGAYLYVKSLATRYSDNYQSTARLLSPYFSSQNKRCITYWSYRNGTVLPLLYLMLSHVGSNTSKILQKETRQEYGRWVSTLRQIDENEEKGKYQLSFVANFTFTNNYQALALDDIFVDYPCKTLFHEGDTFSCDGGKTRLNVEQKCDFVVDCVDGSDEADCGAQCTFEEDTCNWVSPSTSTDRSLKWIRTSGKVNGSLLSTDHNADDSGFYLLAFSPNYYSYSEISLVSPRYSRAYASCVLYFWFFMASNSSYMYDTSLHITYLGINHESSTTVFKLTKNLSPDWHRGQAVIGRVNGLFSVTIAALPSYSAPIAIDDLEFENCGLPEMSQSMACNGTEYRCQNGRCISDDFLCDFNDDCGDFTDEDIINAHCDEVAGHCDFEEGFCDWSFPTAYPELQPTRNSKVQRYAQQAPERDHTLNSMYGSAVSFQNPYSFQASSRTGSLRSPTMLKFGETCKFVFFCMYQGDYKSNKYEDQPDIGSITVFSVRDVHGVHRTHRTLSTAFGLYYEKVVVDLSDIDTPFQVIVSVTTGTDRNGFWALDDFSFTNGCEMTGQPLPDVFTTTPLPTTPQICESDQHVCGDGKCLNRDKICDFEPQCSDKSDEANCGACDFNNGSTCGWIDKSLGKYMWSLVSPQGYANPLPGDTYLSVVPNPDGDVVSGKAVIQADGLRNTSAACSVKFSYLLSSKGKADLQLSIVDDSSVDNRAWKRENDFTNNWAEAYYTLGRRTGVWGLKFTANIEEGEATVGLNNIEYVDCALPGAKNCESTEFKCEDGTCINKTLLCDFSKDCGDGSDEENCDDYLERCDFETGFCNWYQDEDTTGPRWERYIGGLVDNSPGVDHTLGEAAGHFLWLRPSKPQQRDRATIQSTVFVPIFGGNCKIRLWYYVSTLHVNEFNVRIKDAHSSQSRNVMTLEGMNDFDGWRRAEVHLTNPKEFQVLIEGQPGAHPTHWLAIDDISFTPDCKPRYSVNPTPMPTIHPSGYCRSHGKFECEDYSCVSKEQVCDFILDCPHGLDEASCPESCDFEKNTSCGWKEGESNPAGLFWTITDGKNKSINYQPMRDSKGMPEGHFLLLHSTALVTNKNASIFVGPVFSSASSNCKFKFSYITNGDLRIVSLLLNSTEFKDPVMMFSVSGDKRSNDWHTVEIGLGRRSVEFNLIFQMLITKSFQSNYYFAVDDIKLEDCAMRKVKATQCPEGMLPCNGTKVCITEDQICDLTDDCGNGYDEQGCGDKKYERFDFESGLLFFTPISDEPFDRHADKWTIGQGAYELRASNNVGPPFDHTLFNPDGHYLYLIGKESRFNESSLLFSPTFRATDIKSCKMRFYVYMHGSLVSRFSVLTRNELGGSKKTVERFDGEQGDYWVKGQATFNESQDFQVILEGRSGISDNSSLAVDDISFTPGCTSFDGRLPYATKTSTDMITTSPPGIECPQNEFHCFNESECRSSIAKCNFIEDCADGSDEWGCVELFCSFEYVERRPDGLEPPTLVSSTCGWHIGVDLASPQKEIEEYLLYIFKIQQANDTSTTLLHLNPTTDVTLNNSEGHYLMVMGTHGSLGDKTFLATPTIGQTGGQCEISFWFFTNGTNTNLKLFLVTQNEKQMLWDNPSVVTRQWMKQRHFIGPQKLVHLTFESEKKHHYDALVALDDIELSHCRSPLQTDDCRRDEQKFRCADGGCIDSGRVCDFGMDCDDGSDEDPHGCLTYKGRCDFEEGQCDDWFTHFFGNIQWAVHTIKQADDIKQDHTKRTPGIGKYLSSQSQSSPWDEERSAYFGSYVIQGKAKGCSVRFWYNIKNGNGRQSELKVYRRVSYPDGLQLLETLKKELEEESFTWVRKETLLSRDDDIQDFEVTFESYFNRSQGRIFLDDLSLTPTCEKSESLLPGSSDIVTIAPSICGDHGMFACKNGNCYNHLQRCNFIDDCGDLTDEEECGTNCTFEFGMCGWFSRGGHDGNWTIAQANGTETDHTLVNSSGHYLKTSFPISDNIGSTAHLQSKTYVKSASKCRLSLWYTHRGYFSGFPNQTSDLFSISKKRQPENQPQELTILRIFANKKDKDTWVRGEAEVGKETQFHLILKSEKTAYSSLYICIDDIEFLDCSPDLPDLECTEGEWHCDNKVQCINIWEHCDGKADCKDGSDEKSCQPIMNAGDCDFSDDTWVQMCRWQNWLDEDIEWKRSSKENKPFNARLGNGASFLYIDGSQEHEGDQAVVSAPYFKASIGLCHLTFWYYARTLSDLSTNSMLEVSTEAVNEHLTPHWHSLASLEDRWRYQHLTVSNRLDYRVLFKGVASNHSFLGLDDVRFTNGCMDGGVPISPNGTLSPCMWYDRQCGSGECLGVELFCDCEEDCEDGSDEKGCVGGCTSRTTASTSESTTSTTTERVSTCEEGWLSCGTSKACVPMLLWCDGVEDCPQGEDESDSSCQNLKCDENEYACRDGRPPRCLDMQKVCDGTKDCQDNSDEIVCSTSQEIIELLKKSYKYCQNDGEMLVSSSGLPYCKCKEKFSGIRCTTDGTTSPITNDVSSPTAETKTSDSSGTAQGGWIAGTVIGILLLIAVVVVVVLEYRKRRNRALVQTRSPQSIENPVYGLPLSDMSHEEVVDLQKPSTSNHGIVNPLYQNT